MTWYIEHRYNAGKAKGKRLKKAQRKRKDVRAFKKRTGRKPTAKEMRGFGESKGRPSKGRLFDVGVNPWRKRKR